MRYNVNQRGPVGACEVNLPASKSLTNRALLLSALAGRGSSVSNAAVCDDAEVMQQALRNDGSLPVDVHGAGTAMRFLTAYFSLSPMRRVITGSERMRHRPIGILVDALRSLGAEISYMESEGFPPLRVGGGGMHGGEVALPATVSSQYISALMMIGPCLSGGLTLRLEGHIASRPYIEMTAAMMRLFGATVREGEGQVIKIGEGGYRATAYSVESDWSASSYWYEIAALSAASGCTIRLTGLNRNSLQGDSAVAELFAPLGIATDYRDGDVVLTRKGGSLPESLVRDLGAVPDLAQTLMATCCGLGVRFSFSGLDNLRVKETDRITAMETELRKLGFVIKDDGAGTVNWDGRTVQAVQADAHPVIATYEDHRMAMSIAPLAMVKGPLAVDNPEVVAKSYPGYWQAIAKAGFTVKEEA